jgi:hypothetical protein
MPRSFARFERFKGKIRERTFLYSLNKNLEEREFNLDSDQFFHKEKELIQNLIEAEKRLQKAREDDPNPFEHETYVHSKYEKNPPEEEELGEHHSDIEVEEIRELRKMVANGSNSITVCDLKLERQRLEELEEAEETDSDLEKGREFLKTYSNSTDSFFQKQTNTEFQQHLTEEVKFSLYYLIFNSS